MTNHDLISDSKGKVDKHGNPYKFNCETCNFHTQKVCNLYVHLKCKKHFHATNGTKPEKKKHFCKHCSYTSIRPYLIKIHTLTQHAEQKPIPDFQCDVCNIDYYDIQHYKDHLETKSHIKMQVKHMLDKKEKLHLQV